MPIYTYLCPDCEFKEERLARYEDKIPCPKCDTMMDKVLDGFGLYNIKGDNSGSTSPKSKGRRK